MLTKRIWHLLQSREFISLATCDFDGNPNAAPKFLLKVEGDFIYLVDYTRGKSWENLKVNPKAALSLMDTEELTGYRLTGDIEIIDKGKQYEDILHELRQKEITLSTKRIIEGIHSGKTHKEFELEIPDKFIIFKMKVTEVVEIGHRGDVRRHNV